MVSDKQKTLNVSCEYAGERLDLFICSSLSNLSRTLVQRLIDENLVLLNQKPSKAGYKLRTNDKISISIPDLRAAKVEGENIALDIVFEDKDLIVINKPQGMVTHPADSVYKGTLVNALLYHCKDSLSGINGVLRPGIVHRLDKETSGLIIVCKNDKAHNEIAKQIEDRKLKRQYLAIVYGKVQYDLGTINRPIGRDKKHRHKMAVISGGRKAVTHWKVLKRVEIFHGMSLLECSLETGRTHQIRVHMASLGHPIIGDKTYGKKNDAVEKMMLHAYKLGFIHPKTKKEIKLEIKMPERFIKVLGDDSRS